MIEIAHALCASDDARQPIINGATPSDAALDSICLTLTLASECPSGLQRTTSRLAVIYSSAYPGTPSNLAASKGLHRASAHPSVTSTLSIRISESSAITCDRTRQTRLRHAPELFGAAKNPARTCCNLDFFRSKASNRIRARSQIRRRRILACDQSEPRRKDIDRE